MKDHIVITDLALQTVIGILPWERELPQKLLLDLEIGIGNARVFTSDDLKDAIDYAQVIERIKALATEKHFSLVEAFAEAVAQMVLDEFSAPWVSVIVRKPAILAGVREVGVKISRGRESVARDQESGIR